MFDDEKEANTYGLFQGVWMLIEDKAIDYFIHHAQRINR